MNDLKLWRELALPTFPWEEGLAHLQELADQSLEVRAGFFGVLDRALQHSQASIRATGFRVLAGAQGLPAWRLLLGGLNDPDPQVRAAAVAALHRSAQADPARWAHAVFHPLAPVRALAAEVGAPSGFEFLFPSHAFFQGKIRSATAPPWIDNHASMDPVVAKILTGSTLEEPERLVLMNYLERGPEVPLSHRLASAEFLATHNQGTAVLPVLVSGLSPKLAAVTSLELFAAVRAITIWGTEYAEQKLEDALWKRSFTESDQGALEVLMTQATSVHLRRQACDQAILSPQQSMRMARLASAFAWGVNLSKFLTGEPFRIDMLVNDVDLGYTRLRENKIHITPMPILRGLRYGADVVRGLIVHELGHHLYHKGSEAEAVWQEADNTGLGRLLNLVADEHLERNLRQRSSRYGDLLKTLNAFAFQHNASEVPVANLLSYLGQHADTVLPQVPLGAARKFGCVVVSSGRLLREMEAAGHSFACFVRALRMGLGNRTGNPKVAQGLALFPGGFRKSEMPDLLDIARRLREIFGDETDLLNDFGMERALASDEGDFLAAGPIRPDEVQQQVQKLLSEGDAKPGSAPRAAWGLNLGPEEKFPFLTNVQKLPHHPDRHAEYARRVARAARQLAKYFQDLGLAPRQQRRRLQGRHFDRTRLRDLILKGDPRILVARQIERTTDLFLGVAIDCSGSMGGSKLEKAKLFGTLLAEALRSQRNIDLRLFGFTDTMLFDVGDQRRCAVHDLQVSGGNNDAGALWHIAQQARRSHRKAKLLVMISDGMPTGCTVNALKGLVLRLTRQRMCCAQVAVQALDQVCFPHYVLVQDENLEVAVRKFGEVVLRLVRQTLGK